MLDHLARRFLSRQRALSLKPKLLFPIVGLMLLSLMGSTLAFLGGTAFTRNQLLRREIGADARHVTDALAERVQDTETSSQLLAADPVLSGALNEDTDVALSTLNSRAVVVRDRFGLDLIQIYDGRGRAHVNLMLSSLYRESLLLDRVEPGAPDLRTVDGHLILLSRTSMPEGAGSVVTGVDLGTELHRIASVYRLSTDLALRHGDTEVGTHAETGAGKRARADIYETTEPLEVGQTELDLILTRSTRDVKGVTTIGLAIMVGSTLITAVLLIALSVVVTRAIAYPIEKLSRAAEAVAEGDLSWVVSAPGEASPLGIGVGDEIGLLTDTFNDMVAQLAGLYDDLERKVAARTRELKTAADVARVVSSTLEMESVLREALTLIADRLNLSHTQVYLVNADSETLVLRAATSPGGQNLVSEGFALPLDSTSLVVSAARDGESKVAQDVTSDPLFLKTPQLLTIGCAGAIPLKVGRRTIGVLYVQSKEPDRLDSQIVDLLHTLGDQMAVGLRNAQLYEELQGYAEELEARVEERAAVIQAQYAQLQAILNSTTDGIVVTGDGGEIVLINSIAEEWLTQSLSPDEADEIREAARELAAAADEREERILELTGLDLQLRAAPVSGSEGEAATAVVAIHDVSHLKTLDRMKSRFVSNVSHELRTPIATIKLLVHLMQKQPENWDDYIDSLAEEAEYQAQLVEDILEISRVDAGRIDLEPEITHLGQLVETTVERHTTEANRRELDLVCQLDGGALAWVDRHRMMQVFNNLIANALRYTPTGGEIIVSTGCARHAGRSWATVTVSDSGMGIPEDELPHIFERFFRGERPRAVQISGTGLGLAIVQEIIELHGGQIQVESTAGEGSTFTVMIPLAASERTGRWSPDWARSEAAVPGGSPEAGFTLS